MVPAAARSARRLMVRMAWSDHPVCDSDSRPSVNVGTSPGAASSRRRDRTWTIRTHDPIAIVSPGWNDTASPRATGRSRTRVPLTLPRSSTANPLPMVSRACWREASGSSMRTSQLSARPTMTDPADGSR